MLSCGFYSKFSSLNQLRLLFFVSQAEGQTGSSLYLYNLSLVQSSDTEVDSQLSRGYPLSLACQKKTKIKVKEE
jgi:hypothetical protein